MAMSWIFVVVYLVTTFLLVGVFGRKLNYSKQAARNHMLGSVGGILLAVILLNLLPQSAALAIGIGLPLLIVAIFWWLQQKAEYQLDQKKDA